MNVSYEYEYVKLASLLPKSNFEQEPNFKSVEKGNLSS